MSEHVKWTDARHARVDWMDVRKYSPKILAETRSWVHGYIVALEDVIHDLGVLLQRPQYDASTDAMNVLKEAMDKIQESFDSAHRTLATLHDLVEEAVNGQELQAPESESEAPRPGPGQAQQGHSDDQQAEQAPGRAQPGDLGS